MHGLKELLMCGAAICSTGYIDKKLFFSALSEGALNCYNEVGKWFFCERTSWDEPAVHIAFTNYGMDLFHHSDRKDLNAVLVQLYE